MKNTLQSFAGIALGIVVFASCSEDKSGKAAQLIPDKIEVEKGSKLPIKNTDSLAVPEKFVVKVNPVVPPPPPPPVPRPPRPWPPDPGPEPWPPEPIIFREPPPEPRPIDDVVDFPELDPEFIGGAEAMLKFIRENVKYPEIDRETDSQGRVFVQFVVEKDGSLSKIEVIRGVSASLDKEAMRVVSKMPNWKPGEVGGKSVRCRARLPIVFRLD